MQTAEEIAKQYSNHPTECERAILRHMGFHISSALEMAADMAADHRCDHSTCNCQGKIEDAIRALVSPAMARERQAREVFKREGLDPDRVRDVFASSTTVEE